jgi:nucleoside-diphosphate-sugar epimerase
LDNIECVIHIAGLAHIFSRKNTATAPFKAANEIGTVNVARAAAEAGVQHFVLISSVSVYGPFTYGIYDEETPCFPVGPYAESKYQAEQRAIEVAKNTGMSLTIFRLATLYGEGDPGNIARLTRTIDKGRFFWIGDGSNQKSLLPKEDAARAILKVAQTHMNGINIYNVSAPPCTMREIVEGLSAALGRRIPKWHIPASLALNLTGLAARLVNGGGRLGNLYDTLMKWLANDIYDTNKFERAFNFKTQVELSQGLNQEVAWYRHLGTTSLTT